jgi:hypothetical protein
MEAKIDIGRLTNLKLQIEKMKEQRQKTKTEMDELEQHAVSALLHMGVRYVDVSNTGQGPFWVLGKEKSDGSFNRERYVEFFSALLGEMKTDPNLNVDKCTALAMNYLKQFEKRRLMLNKLSRPGQRGVEDLKRWLETGQ